MRLRVRRHGVTGKQQIRPQRSRRIKIGEAVVQPVVGSEQVAGENDGREKKNE